MSQEELEKAYNEAAFGKEAPGLAILQCPFCGKTHVITPKQGDACQALLDWMIEHRVKGV